MARKPTVILRNNHGGELRGGRSQVRILPESLRRMLRRHISPAGHLSPAQPISPASAGRISPAGYLSPAHHIGPALANSRAWLVSPSRRGQSTTVSPQRAGTICVTEASLWMSLLKHEASLNTLQDYFHRKNRRRYTFIRLRCPIWALWLKEFSG